MLQEWRLFLRDRAAGKTQDRSVERVDRQRKSRKATSVLCVVRYPITLFLYSDDAVLRARNIVQHHAL